MTRWSHENRKVFLSGKPWTACLMVFDQEREYGSQRACIGRALTTLERWVARAKGESARRQCVTQSEQDSKKALDFKNSEFVLSQLDSE